jgi:hypothetical protein
MTAISLKINGHVYAVDVCPQTPLLFGLRSWLKLTTSVGRQPRSDWPDAPVGDTGIQARHTRTKAVIL